MRLARLTVGPWIVVWAAGISGQQPADWVAAKDEWQLLAPRYAQQERAEGHTHGADPADSAVRSVVERYLHGLKFNDTLSLRDAFWPEARLFFVGKDGRIGQLTQEQWYASFAGSVGHEEQGDLRIAAIDITGDAASVKVVEDYSRSRYTDYVSLLFFNRRWWIVNKIYTVAPRSP